MPFVKLDRGILDSTVWADADLRGVFITSLCMADPREFTEAVPQIAVASLEHTGWSAPAGWYGFIAAAAEGISQRARVTLPRTLRALERLGTPDLGSRSQEFEGRRMIRINGGYIVLNFDRYRTRDYTAAERMKRFRRHHRTLRRNERNATRHVTESESQSKSESQSERRSRLERSEQRSSRSTDALNRNSPLTSSDDGVQELFEVLHNIAPQFEPYSDRTIANLIDRGGGNPWYVAAVVCERQEYIRHAQSLRYIEKTLREKRKSNSAIDDPAGYVAFWLKKFGFMPSSAAATGAGS